MREAGWFPYEPPRPSITASPYRARPSEATPPNLGGEFLCRLSFRMKLGFFTMPIHPVGRNLGETLREDREFALIAEKLGFVEGFYGEHITDGAETITSGLIFIA